MVISFSSFLVGCDVNLVSKFFGFAIETVDGIPGRLLWSYRFRALVGCAINLVSKFFGYVIATWGAFVVISFWSFSGLRHQSSLEVLWICDRKTVGRIWPPGGLLWSYRFGALVGCVINLVSKSSSLDLR